MADINLKKEETEKIQIDLKTVANNIRELDQEIYNEATRTQSGWTGANANAFLEEMHELKKLLDNECKELTFFIETELRKARESFENADSESAARAASLNGGM